METQFIKLNMIPSGVNPCFHVSQYDIGRSLGFMIYNGSEVVDLDNYNCTIEATRSDGVAITANVTTDDNVGTFETTATMTNKTDKYRGQFIIVDGESKRIASLPFDMDVCKAAMDENSESIEEDASLYQQYTQAVQGAIAEAKEDIQSEENARIAAVSAEATARANADTTLQNNIDAEATARANAITAEATARQTADNTLQGNINSEASTRASADSNLQSQINQIVAPSGEAPSAAEVQNARIGADGVTYSTLGDAIRTNDEKMMETIEQIAPRFKSTIDYTKGQYVIYGTSIYRFTTDHPAGDWTGNDVVWERVSIVLQNAYKPRGDFSGNFADTTIPLGFYSGQLANCTNGPFSTTDASIWFNYARLTTGLGLMHVNGKIYIHYLGNWIYINDDFYVSRGTFSGNFADTSVKIGWYSGQLANCTNGPFSTTDTSIWFSYCRLSSGLGMLHVNGVVYVQYLNNWFNVSSDSYINRGTLSGSFTGSSIKIGYYSGQMSNMTDGPELITDTTVWFNYCRFSTGFGLLSYSGQYWLQYVTSWICLGGAYDYHSALTGKSWYVCGDSYSVTAYQNAERYEHLLTSGKYKGYDAIYPYIIGNRCGVDVHDIAVSGGTLVTIDDVAQNDRYQFAKDGNYNSIPTTADYITIWFGGNDVYWSTDVGTPESTDTTTFWGALNTVLTYFVTNYPDTHIGLIVTNGADLANPKSAQIKQATIDAAKKYGLSYFDMNTVLPYASNAANSDIDPTIKALRDSQYQISQSNGHPNERMHRLESHYIEQWLLEI